MRTKHFSRWAFGAAVALLVAWPATAGDPVMSLHALHPGREIVLEPAFEGKWVFEDSASLMLDVKKSNDGYELWLFSTTEKETLRFDAHLVRLGSALFADIQQTTEAGLFALYPHVFAKIRVDRDELRFDFLNEEYARQALENKRADLAHEKLDNTVVLTAPTRELQNFVESSAFDDEAFDDTVKFTRLKEQPGNSQP